MLVEIYLALFAAAFIFAALSMMPVGEKGKVYRKTEGEEYSLETQKFVWIFAWISMGIFYILAITSMDIVFLECDTVIDSINTSVSNFSNYSTSWSCYEHHHFDGALAWLCTGLGSVMLVYAIFATFMWSAGALAGGVAKLMSKG